MIDLEEIAYDCLREMYSEADPPLDFDEVLENPDEFDEDWYKNHTLDSERQREIVEKHCDKHELNESERSSIHWTAILDLGPTTVDNND